jgi:hypothetical protein
MVTTIGYFGIHPDDDPMLDDDPRGRPEAEEIPDQEVLDPPVETNHLWIDMAD